MATIEYVLSYEDENESCIHLHQEGLFLRAYDRSAYLFLQETGSSYKLTKRYIKLVDRSIVSLGFPLDSLAKHFTIDNANYINTKHICISQTAAKFDIDLYNEWHKAIACTNITSDQKNTISSSEISILDRLLSFRLEQSTAIDCLVFVSQLQKELLNLRNK